MRGEGRSDISHAPIRMHTQLWKDDAGMEDVAQRRGADAIIVDENDVLRDEGEAYARKLSQAGVRALPDVYTVRYVGRTSFQADTQRLASVRLLDAAVRVVQREFCDQLVSREDMPVQVAHHHPDSLEDQVLRRA
jgi:alpha/beta hydrolase fold